MILNWGLVFLGLGIGDFSNPRNTNSQFIITNWSFYHQLVISTFSSLIGLNNANHDEDDVAGKDTVGWWGPVHS